MYHFNFQPQRLFLITWIILPILLVWLSISYLTGLNHHPDWANNICQVPTTNQPKLASFNWQKTGLITLWFDDGWRSQYYSAFPILQKKEQPAAIAVVTNYVGLPDYVNWPQLKRLQHFGWETTSHTKTHNCDLIKSDITQIESELADAKKIIESEGLMADNFVTPCGTESPQLIDIAKKEYLSLRTSGAGLNPIPVTNPYRILTYVLNNKTTLAEVNGMIEQAKESKQWLILTFHQIDNTHGEYAISPSLFEQISDQIKTSTLPVVLPSQVLDIHDTQASL